MQNFSAPSQKTPYRTRLTFDDVNDIVTNHGGYITYAITDGFANRIFAPGGRPVHTKYQITITNPDTRHARQVIGYKLVNPDGPTTDLAPIISAKVVISALKEIGLPSSNGNKRRKSARAQTTEQSQSLPAQQKIDPPSRKQRPVSKRYRQLSALEAR